MAAEMQTMRAEFGKQLTDACNAVRTQANERITNVEQSLSLAVSRLQWRLDIGLLLLAALLVAAIWIGYARTAVGTVPPVAGPERIDAMVRIIDEMDSGDPALWTVDGKPRVDYLARSLSARLGYQVRVTRIERNLALAIQQELGDE